MDPLWLKRQYEETSMITKGCGFRVIDEKVGFADLRGAPIEIADRAYWSALK